MPFDANGNFTRVMNWTSDYENDIEIVCDRHDLEDDNFASGLSACFCKDGRSVATGNFKMGGLKITGMGDGSASNDAINKGQLDSAKSTLQTQIDAINTKTASSDYIGDIKASVRTANHGDWLLCDGQAVSRTTYADLYALIGTTYGSGDGSTTFNVPDFTSYKHVTATTVTVGGDGTPLGFQTKATGNTTADYYYALGGSVNTESAVQLFKKNDNSKPAIADGDSSTSQYKPDKFVGVIEDATKSGLTGAITSTATFNYFIRAL